MRRLKSSWLPSKDYGRLICADLFLEDIEFLEEAFSDITNFEEYMKENHYTFLVQGKKLYLKDCVEEIYRAH